jgi:hypothetical protein
LMILQLRQIRLTDARTFIFALSLCSDWFDY